MMPAPMMKRRCSVHQQGSSDRMYSASSAPLQLGSAHSGARRRARLRARGAHANAALRRADEGHESSHVVGRVAGLDARERSPEMRRFGRRATATARRIAAMRCGVESRAPETDAVHAAHGVGPVHDAERRHVAAGARQPAQQGEPADPHVLMHDAIARDEGAVARARRGPRATPRRRRSSRCRCDNCARRARSA